MLSTEEAAAVLGVTPRRVQELASNGTLSGKKTSGVWLISKNSVEERLRSTNRKGGRPLLGHGRNEKRFTLMNRTHEVAALVYNINQRAFVKIGEADPLRAPIGLAVKPGLVSLQAFSDWWHARGIPQARRNLQLILDEAGVSIPEELLQRNLGLSLSDQYWIRPEGSGLAWEDVNFFHNPFEQVSGKTADHAVLGKSAAARPDNTSNGNLEKTWERRGGVPTLLKNGTGFGQEPYNEVVATALHRRLLNPGSYVPYSLEGEGAAARCACPVFLTSEEEYVPAAYVEHVLNQESQHSSYDHYLACCEALGVQNASAALDRMIVCDDILANRDRHWRNFGLVRNVETLECRPAPIFDSGSSLWCNVNMTKLAAGEHSFASKQFHESPAKQMLLVTDLSWLNPGALEGFVDEAVGILAGNSALGERLPYIRAALEWRVNRIINIAEWD